MALSLPDIAPRWPPPGHTFDPPALKDRTANDCMSSVTLNPRACPNSPIARLLLMPHDQYHGPIPIEPIQSQVSAIAKPDQPFTEPWIHLLDGSARSRMFGHHTRSLPDGPDRVWGRRGVFGGQGTYDSPECSGAPRASRSVVPFRGVRSSPASNWDIHSSASSWVICFPESRRLPMRKERHAAGLHAAFPGQPIAQSLRASGNAPSDPASSQIP